MTTRLLHTWIRRMDQLKTDAYIPKTRKIRFSLNTPKIEQVFLAGDSNGCMLVVPEAFEVHEHGVFPGYQL